MTDMEKIIEKAEERFALYALQTDENRRRVIAEELLSSGYGKVRAKKLEWDGQTGDGETIAAEPDLGPRYAILSAKGGFHARTGTGAGYFDGQPLHETIYAAKRACQKHYQRLVISCLDGVAPVSDEPSRLQERIKPWMQECFGAELAADHRERCDRFLEEAVELVQSCGYPQERAHAVIRWKFDGRAGQTPQEVGGVMLTLAALCSAYGLDMDACGEAEMSRVEDPEVIKKIQAKQDRKRGEIERYMRSVSSQAVGRDELRAACEQALQCLQSNFVVCPSCGHYLEDTNTENDAALALKQALSSSEESGK